MSDKQTEPVAGERERIAREINAYGLAVTLNAHGTGTLPPDAGEVADRILALRSDGSYEYLVRLLATIAPGCEPLPSLLGVCTQIDNAVAGLRSDGLLEKLKKLERRWKVEAKGMRHQGPKGRHASDGVEHCIGDLTELRSMEEAE